MAHTEESAADVVLLHSGGMSGDQWRRTADAIGQAGFRAVAPDLLGSGRSAPWPDGKALAFTDDVAFVDGLLREIGRPVHLVGHSYGGFVALCAARLDPSRVSSIALYDPVAFGVLDPARDADALGDLSRVHFGWSAAPAAREAWLRSFVDYWGGEGSWSRLREPARAEFTRVGWVVHEEARSLTADTTPASAYRALAAPALLMTGETTPLAAQRVVERLGESLPAARVERIAGAGHMGPLTHVPQVNALLLAHLASASGSAGGRAV